MTIIVWDGKNLVTDRAASDGAAHWQTKKAWNYVDERGPCVISGVGMLSNILLMREWYKSGAHHTTFPKEQHTPHWANLLVVTENGLLRYEQCHVPIEHGVTPCAFGEGRDFALGALAMGADAIKAVQIAIDHSSECGLGTEVYTL